MHLMAVVNVASATVDRLGARDVEPRDAPLGSRGDGEGRAVRVHGDRGAGKRPGEVREVCPGEGSMHVTWPSVAEVASTDPSPANADGAPEPSIPTTVRPDHATPRWSWS